MGGRKSTTGSKLFVVAEAKKQTHHADRSWRAMYESESQRNRAERAQADEGARRIGVVRDALARWREAREIRELVRELHGAKLSWLVRAEAYADQLERGLREEEAG